MVDYTGVKMHLYNAEGSQFNTSTTVGGPFTWSDASGGDWLLTDTITGSFMGSGYQFVGHTDFGYGGELYPVMRNPNNDQHFVLTRTDVVSPSTWTLTASSFTACFGKGTKIATPAGATAVEALSVGDHVLTQEGKPVPVLWVGRQQVLTVSAGHKTAAVRITAGALGGGLPESDLVVTGDHGIWIEGMIINAAALVNHDTIDFVPPEELAPTEIYYHIELENHDVILANGAPAETFLDVPHRRMFDNFDEYLDLYGAERLMQEMTRPRIGAARLVPEAIRARLSRQGLAPGLTDRKAS